MNLTIENKKSMLISIVNKETLKVEFITVKGDYAIVLTENIDLIDEGVYHKSADGKEIVKEHFRRMGKPLD